MNTRISTAVIILLLVASGILFTQTALAVSTPSVPEFTVKYMLHSYSVTTTNPYTGAAETTVHQNNTIEVSIKNQPLTDATHPIYYNVRVKPHFEGDWTELYPLWKLPNAPYNAETKSWQYSQYLYTEEMPLALQTPLQSSSDYTIIAFTVNENTRSPFTNLPANAQLDFQVQAITGHDSQCWTIQHPLYPEYGGYYGDAVAYDTDSGWGSTQTITIDSVESTSTPTFTSSPQQSPTPTVQPTQAPTATPSQPETQASPQETGGDWAEVGLFAALGVIAALLLVIALMYRQNRTRQKAP